VLYDAFGKMAAGIVGRVLLEDPAQQIAAAGDREADREHELVAEGSVIHREICSCYVLTRERQTTPDLSRREGLGQQRCQGFFIARALNRGYGAPHRSKKGWA
jgi:hypothetical protein